MSGPKFGLNLDGTLRKRSQMQERGEDQPGVYSPRPSSSTAAPPSSNPSAQYGTQPPSPLSPPSATSSSAGKGKSSVPSSIPSALKKHVDPSATVAESVAAEEAAIGITDPDMDVILSAKSRLSGGGASSERSSSTGSVAGAGVSGSSAPGPRASGSALQTSSSSGSAPGRRAAAALATLVEHQNARQQRPSSDSKADASLPSTAMPSAMSGKGATAATPSGAAVTHSASRFAKGHSSATAPTSTTTAPSARADASNVRSMRLEEAYILGRTFRQFVASTSRLSINGITGNKGGGTFRQNPSQYVSAMASHGDYVAVGDRTGHVAVMKRRSMTAEQTNGLLEVEIREDAKWLSVPSITHHSDTPSTAAVARYPAPRTRDLYEFHVGQQAYTAVIDPLNSVEVTPNVSALAFLPQASPAAYLLTANEKVPKLYKLMSVRESAMPFRAVDKIDSKTIGPLTAASRASTVAMKPVARYALSHEYNIHSICPLADSEQFVTADDLTMQLWCTEYPDTSIETYDIRPPYDEEPREAIRCVRTFPHEPFLLFAVTSAGNVRVIDMRQTLRWSSQTAQMFVNPPRASDGNFSNVTNSLSDCALSPCGRYIAGRDFMTVCLWDVRVAANSFPSSPSRRATTTTAADGPAASTDYNVVQRWELHPSLSSDLDTLYQSDLLFERFDLQFVNHRQVCTGGFGNSLYTIDVTQSDTGIANSSTASAAAKAEEEEGAKMKPSAGVQVFNLPTNEGVADITKTTLHATSAAKSAAAAAGEKGKTAGGNTLELGSRITLLSRPTMSLGGTCGMLLCCGQVVMQLSYSS